MTIDHSDAAGVTRRFRATLQPGVYEHLLEALHKAGFPEAPRERIGSGGTRLISAIAHGRELRTRPMPYHAELATWANLFSLIDAIVAETTDGLAATREEGREPPVVGASELTLFKPSPEAEEPPLGEDANEIVAAAWRLAIEHKHLKVTPAHLLVAFVLEHGYHFARLGLDPDRVLEAGKALFTWDPEQGEPEATPAFELVRDVARRMAAEDESHEATLRHLLRALLEAGGTDVPRVLQQNKLPDALLAGRTRQRIFALSPSGGDATCPRCGAAATETRWCQLCGRALAHPSPFETGSALDRVLPVIEAHDFPERAAVVHCALCAVSDVAGVPWIAFELESERGAELLTSAKMTELGATLERLEEHAIANLGRLPASWTPRWVPMGDREVDVLFCEDEPRACERILDKPFLLHAQSMLGSNALAAAAPRHGLLLVTRLADLPALMSLSRHYFENAENEPVSPWGFAIQNGAISGPISSG